MYIGITICGLITILIIKFVQEYKYSKRDGIIYKRTEISNYANDILHKYELHKTIKFGKIYMSNSILGELCVIDREEYNVYDVLAVGHEIGHLVRDQSKKHLYGRFPFIILYLLSIIYYFRCMYTKSLIGGKNFYIAFFVVSTSIILSRIFYIIYDECWCSKFAKQEIISNQDDDKEYSKFLIMSLFTHIISMYIWYSIVIYLGYMVMINL